MSHYAILNEHNIVTQVIVGKDENEPLPDGYSSWEEYYGGKQTSYNTQRNIHLKGGTPFRKNYAGIGYKYDSDLDAFIAPQPFKSWMLNEDTCCWEAPILMPNDNKNYVWNESELNWIEY